ncbi:MAG: Calvin cycle protein CP12 [Microcystaceae cyanobacterium]
MPNTNLQEKIDKELALAREITKTKGATSSESRAAWDAVEELKTEASHQKQNKTETNSLQDYCSNNPDALECRIYDD